MPNAYVVKAGFPLTTSTDNNPARPMEGDDSLVVEAGGLIHTKGYGSFGVFVHSAPTAAAPTSLIIDGTITAERDAAIVTSGAANIVIGRTGRIEAELSSVQSHRGEIVSLMGATTINNAGYIGSFAINILSFGRESAANNLTLINTGTIESKQATTTNKFTVRASMNADSVTNSGTMKGGIDLRDGNDLYDGRLGHLLEGTLFLGAGNDTAYGGSGDETFGGQTGDDFIDGGGGSDTIREVSMVDLRITGPQNTGDGFDTIVNVENIAGTGGQDTFIGNDGDNILHSMGGVGNLLRGGGGSDTAAFAYVKGDPVTVDLSRTGLQTVSNQGESVTFESIENLIGSDGNDTFTGNAVANVFTGGKGSDTLSGGGGHDTAMFSGASTDYVITDLGNRQVTVEDKRANQDGKDSLKDVRFAEFKDKTVLLYNTGPDGIALTKTAFAENTLVNTPIASVSAHDADGDALTYTLVDPTGTFKLDGHALVLLKSLDYETKTSYSLTVESKDEYGLATTQTLTVSVTDVADTPGTPGDPGTLPDAPLVLTGTAGANTLAGKGNNDILSGLAGKDRLYGNGGNDKLTGGLGNDSLWGGAGQDIFVFNAKLSKTNALNKKQNLDRIADFSVADDTIHLAKSVFTKIAKKGVLAKSAFHAGTKAHDASDRIVYNKKTGALLYDKDGTGAAEAIQFATLDRNLKGFSNLDLFVI
jgi:Ca2+-binding RTX toxin-like protein